MKLVRSALLGAAGLVALSLSMSLFSTLINRILANAAADRPQRRR